MMWAWGIILFISSDLHFTQSAAIAKLQSTMCPFMGGDIAVSCQTFSLNICLHVMCMHACTTAHCDRMEGLGFSAGAENLNYTNQPTFLPQQLLAS